MGVPNKDVNKEVTAHVNMVMETLSASDSALKRIVNETGQDEVLQSVIDCIKWLEQWEEPSLCKLQR